MVALLRWGKPHTPKGDFGEIGSESDSLAERKNATMNPQRVRVVYNCAVSFLSESRTPSENPEKSYPRLLVLGTIGRPVNP